MKIRGKEISLCFLLGIREKRGQGDIMWNRLIPWIIAVVVLVVFVLAIMFLSGWGSDAIKYFKDIIRFRR